MMHTCSPELETQLFTNHTNNGCQLTKSKYYASGMKSVCHMMTPSSCILQSPTGFHGVLVESSQSPWSPRGVLVESPWSPHGVLMESPWSPHGVPMESPWSPRGVSMDSS